MRELLDIHDLPLTGFVRQAQLVPGIIPISSATLWRKVKNGSFPRPVKLGPRVTAWRAEEVREWIARQSPSTSTR